MVKAYTSNADPTPPPKLYNIVGLTEAEYRAVDAALEHYGEDESVEEGSAKTALDLFYALPGYDYVTDKPTNYDD